MPTTLSTRFLDHARANGLFPAPGRALLAVSGGADSVAMLELFTSVADELGLDLVVAHVDHGIAPNSSEVARDVEQLAAGAGLPYHAARLELGPSASETAAREARYAELRRMQREAGCLYLVTAHHLDDQAETVLYRVMRGTGPAGLAAIRACGPDGLVRPLLPFRREELAAWVAHRARETGQPLSIHSDPANEDVRHDRSWLRNKVLPLLRQRWGTDLDERLATLAGAAGREQEAWGALLRAVPGLLFRMRRGAAEVARDPLRRYDNALSEAILRALAREVGCALTPTRAGRLAEFIRSRQSGRVMELGGGFEAEVSFDRVRIASAAPREAASAVSLGSPDHGSVQWGSWTFTWRTEPAEEATRESTETWVTDGTLTVRGVGQGDRLVPLGGVGRRKVRRLLMEARVPMTERGAYPVLVRGTHVLWLPGVCRSRLDIPRAGAPALRIRAEQAGEDVE